jgi:phage gpG-like protein
METKEELIESIKEWIKIDNEISSISTELKNKKNKKKELTNNLVEVMKKNSIDCFDVTGGGLFYKKSKVKKAINGKFLLENINKYLNDSTKAEEMAKYIMDNREEKIKETIMRKIDK